MKRVIQTGERCCESPGIPGATAQLQRQIAERAFELWLERGFRDGSPQEDWLLAQQEVRQRSVELVCAGGANR